MFKLTQSPTFWTRVEAEVTAENGSKNAVRFRAQYKRLTVHESKALTERQREAGEDDRFFLREILVGLDEIVDDDGQTMPFSGELVDRLVGLGFGPALTLAYMQAMPKARAVSSGPYRV